MKKIFVRLKPAVIGLAVTLLLGGSARLEAGSDSNSSSDGSHGWWDSLTTNPGQGDNRDDAHGGKADRTGDGNSGQGDDLHKKQRHPDGDMDHRPDPDGRCCEMHHRRHQMMLEKFDTDHDGKLSDEERAKAREFFEAKRKEMIKRFDTNGDGKLDENERAAARDAMIQEHWQQFAKNHPEAAKEIDKNGNGKLDKEEIEAAKQHWRAKQGDRKGPPPGCCCKDGDKGPPSFRYPAHSREYPPDSNLNRSGGADNTNPGGQGNSSGYDNPGKGGRRSHTNRSGGGDGTNPGGHGNSSGFDNPGNN